jgi:drug/metabolite transporter (DMT)-like permease
MPPAVALVLVLLAVVCFGIGSVRNTRASLQIDPVPLGLALWALAYLFGVPWPGAR